MSISQDSAATIVCTEVFDETSHPSNEEVLEYARRLGIDPDAEPHLLELAREGLMAALPKGWSPCYHEASGAWYYYQASTGTTTWEHPMDAVYRELVNQARAGNGRQMSVEEDSKTTAKDLESHEEATLPRTSAPKSEKTQAKNPPLTRIPKKLEPLRKPDQRRTTDKTRQTSEPKYPTPLASDRATRDYTNLKFQDPKFYECPRVLDQTDSAAGSPESLDESRPDELDLKEVLKRSESLSPRHEKDWEQLASRFSSEENIIDIDKLSVTGLTARTDRQERFDKEKHPSQFVQPKELTLSGGGTMFLKSNRSRDATPCQDGSGKLEEFKTLASAEEAGNVWDRLKSILKEKQSEDEDRPVEEERKSVRFDLEKEVDIKFTYSGSEDDWDSVTEEDNNVHHTTSKPPVQRVRSQSFDEDDQERREQAMGIKKSLSSDKIIEPSKKSGKVVGKRFVVQNVSDSEHLSQMARQSLSRDNSLEYAPTSSKLDRIKNIDLVSKSETDCSLAKSSDSEDQRRTKPRKSSIRFAKERNSDESELSREELETARVERVNKTKLEFTRSLEEVRTRLSKDHERDIEALKREFEMRLEQTKRELDENFLEEKKLLQQNLNERLEELKREMAEKEEQEIQKLIAEMDEARLENLKKVRAELEVCYEKERQEILANLKTELDERKRELLELRNQEIGKLENEHERDLGDEKLAKLNEFELMKQHTEKIDAMKKELEKEFDELRTELRIQQREKITKITEDHEKCLAEILRDFRIDEDLARKMYKQRLEEIRADFSRDAEKEAMKHTERAIQQDSLDFEKMRCEKRLLQDKYTALKDKYMKLKNDVRLAVERRSKRKEGYTTTSETERSTSTRTRTERTESSEQNTPLRNARQGSATSGRHTSPAAAAATNATPVATATAPATSTSTATTAATATAAATMVATATTAATGAATATAPAAAAATATATTAGGVAGATSSIPGAGATVAPSTTAMTGATTLSRTRDDSQTVDRVLEDPRSQRVSSSGFQKVVARAQMASTSSRAAARFESDAETTGSETNANTVKRRRNFSKKQPNTGRPSSNTNGSSSGSSNNNNNNNNNLENPVENIRKQLEKLEDLGDQLPSNETAYTLRYPFQDKAPANASSELEFFRHRIHVEKDSLRRAREALRHQKNAFQGRQRAWKQRSARATLEQLVQEERELSDMEVSLHRTRSLLGEKVIHLRHLEQSLERVANAKRNENDLTTTCSSTKNDELTLSDMSSASSGFSSTDLGTDTFIDKPDHYQESTEIIASLENLNSEIREIWCVLNKRQDSNISPPPTLMCSYLRWLRFHHLTAQPNNMQGSFGTPNIQSNILSQLTGTHHQPPTTATQNIIAQYGPNSGFTTSVGTVEKNSSNLMERTRNLRDWLRQARVETTDLISPGQATL